ncbi:MAG: DUF1287 domain-containing protein [Candidatus Delongbacteria bacterium]|nr:DUF1287 domain-containing protein [Candidatus Delongbacteria bacterium]MBN2835559.1 DUF1287 domain-containing protein [Candidatus Delongbacteria bacterium]
MNTKIIIENGILRYLYIFIILFCHNFINADEIFFQRLADSSFVLTKQKVVYDPAYRVIKYPNGDVPADKGVCTDVIIRVYRKLGIDLQKEVHEDMKSNFNQYPKNWGLSHTDKNIDHRRVQNLMTFFTRHGETKKITNNPSDYLPGDIICWNLGGGQLHIGIVSRIKSSFENRYLIVHNIGGGQVLEDCLFSFEIIGHYTYER